MNGLNRLCSSTQRGCKFSDDQINLIRNIYDGFGEISGKEIAKMFHTDSPTISMIGRRKIYLKVQFIKLEKEFICNSIKELYKQSATTLED